MYVRYICVYAHMYIHVCTNVYRQVYVQLLKYMHMAPQEAALPGLSRDNSGQQGGDEALAKALQRRQSALKGGARQLLYP